MKDTETFTLTSSNEMLNGLLKCVYLCKYIYAYPELLVMVQKVLKAIDAGGITPRDIIFFTTLHIKAHEVYADINN